MARTFLYVHVNIPCVTPLVCSLCVESIDDGIHGSFVCLVWYGLTDGQNGSVWFDFVGFC